MWPEVEKDRAHHRGRDQAEEVELAGQKAMRTSAPATGQEGLAGMDAAHWTMAGLRE